MLRPIRPKISKLGFIITKGFSMTNEFSKMVQLLTMVSVIIYYLILSQSV